MTDEAPTPSDPSGGRDATGRFGAGNKFARGNPFGAAVNKLRAALFAAVTEDDLTQVIEAMKMAAKGGDVPAAKELLLRVLGPPVDYELVERLDELEKRIAELTEAKR